MSQTVDTPTPPSLFDTAQYEVIIRSSDGQGFHMYKIDLARSSPVFEGMFALPQPSTPKGEPTEEVPTIHVSETAEILHILFRFCLPHSTPMLDDLSLTARVLEGAEAANINLAEDHLVLQVHSSWTLRSSG